MIDVPDDAERVKTSLTCKLRSDGYPLGNAVGRPRHVVVSTPPIQAKVASTYDEAACADAARPDDVNTDDTNCSEPPPAAVPAVLDCNDARVSLWLGEMIGSCDMPRPQPPTGGPAAVRAAGPNGDRLCSDGHCGLEAAPLRAAPRLFDDTTVALAPGLRSPLHFPLDLDRVRRRAARLAARRKSPGTPAPLRLSAREQILLERTTARAVCAPFTKVHIHE